MSRSLTNLFTFLVFLGLTLLCGVALAQDESGGGKSILGVFLDVLPVVLAAVVPPTVAFLRATVAAAVPSKLLPVLVPLLAAVVTSVANVLGLDIGITTTELEGASAPLWDSALTGLLIGSAGVGIHQIKKKTVDGK